MFDKTNRNKLFKNTSILMACISLTACYQTYNPPANLDINKPLYKNAHPIKITKGKQEIDFNLPKSTGGLTPNQVANSANFILDYMDKGEGLLEIWMPRGNLNKTAIKNAHLKIRAIIRDASIPASVISYNKYDAYGDTQAPIGMKFDRLYAKVKKCGGFSKNLAINHDNENYKSFGCATQTNLALMVSNPRDLLGRTNMSAASAERRQIIWTKYIRGQATGASKSAEDKASVKDVSK